MKSTSQLLTDYADALRKWKRMKEVRDDAPENHKLKPLPPEPQPRGFNLKPDDEWTIKTHDLIMGKRITLLKKVEVKLPVRRTK